MASYDIGKVEVCAWIRENFPPDAEILDVGACDGKWRHLLPEYKNMDAVEAWLPNAKQIVHLYREVYCCDIVNWQPKRYDLIIFGDVIEHLNVEEAQKVIQSMICTDMIIAVPFLYPQGALYGNPFEVHRQPDLTAEIFAKRYPGFEVLVDTGQNYCFYHKEKTNE